MGPHRLEGPAVVHQGLAAVLPLPLAHQEGGVDPVQVGLGAGDLAVAGEQLVLDPGDGDLSLVEVGHVVAGLLQVAGDVAGDEDGVVLVLDKVQKFVQNFIPHHRVKTRGGLVQHQQPGPVAEGGGDGELHLHASGQLLDLLVRRQVELF